jgi:outer membrane protein TolC
MMGRPDLRALRQEVDVASENVRYRRNQLYPSLDLFAGYGRRGSSTMQLPPPLPPEASLDDALDQIKDASVPNETIGFMVTVPLGRMRERAAFRQSKAMREQAGLRVKQKEEWIAREIADAHQTVQLQLQRASTARDAVDLARSSVRAEERRLEAGTGTLLFVLQLQSELVAVQSTEVRARADYNQAVARLRQADASLLDRWGIVFEEERSRPE